MTTNPKSNATTQRTPDGFEYKQTDEGSEIRLENANARHPGTRHASVRVHPKDRTYEIRCMDYDEETNTFEPRSIIVLTQNPIEAKTAAIDIIEWELIGWVSIPQESPLERIRNMKEAFKNAPAGPKRDGKRRYEPETTPITANVDALTSLFLYVKQNPHANYEQLAAAVGQSAHVVRHWLATSELEPHSSYGHLRDALSTMGWTPDTQDIGPEAERIRAIATALEKALETPSNNSNCQ